MIRLNETTAVDPAHVQAVEFSSNYDTTRVLVAGEWVCVDMAVGEVLEALGVGV